MTDAAAAQNALTELLKQQADINAKVDAQLKATREAALATVKEYCTAYKFTANDLKGALVVKRATATKATPRKSTRAKK
jgi:DNA-binding protein H-NS